MNHRIIYLACALMILCASPSAALAQRVQKDGTTVKKKSEITVKPRPKANTTARTDLSVIGEQPNCFEHSARVRVSRTGAQLTNSFYVSLKIYKNNSVIESMEQLVAPFSNTYQHIYFTTETKLLRMEAGEQLSCQFTADVHQQVAEGNENNNVANQIAPLIGFGPHE
jgi:hypothetical protein